MATALTVEPRLQSHFFSGGLASDEKKRDWVETKVTTAFEEERERKQTVMFAIRRDDAVMGANEAWAAELRARNIGDFRQWKDHNA